MITDFLTSLQQECADRLAADPFFQFIPVLTENIDDIANERDRALSANLVTGGKTGTCVTIVTPEANANFENVQGPLFDEVNIVAQIEENVIVNRDPDGTGTGLRAAQIVVAVCRSFHQFFPLSANGPLVAIKPTVQLAKGTDGNLTYLCRFRTMSSAAELPAQLTPPVAVNNAGVYTLTNNTPGAAVFYTTNGTNPSPRNPSAALALAAFTPGPGLTLKARAWLAGYLASDTTTINT